MYLFIYNKRITTAYTVFIYVIVRNGHGNLIKRIASADSTMRSTDSEDSLGEYGDPFPDPTKFNEDGSFIGQYVSSVDEMTTMDVKLAVAIGLGMH